MWRHRDLWWTMEELAASWNTCTDHRIQLQGFAARILAIWREGELNCLALSDFRGELQELCGTLWLLDAVTLDDQLYGVLLVVWIQDHPQALWKAAWVLPGALPGGVELDQQRHIVAWSCEALRRFYGEERRQ
eukprot:CAMPEP_0115139146 /NCGR_PEP_ID=MMETSP0227-20121206/58106_1 /TAXON_ID=89957 /ORGANISM="Polarella glacialis, Strain CCMP 1383" /LENGTH=132 /DNA_ID=CAMNT_0002546937 /DNA_START=36 /DNA_END=432 /DNA_ORIENTATION=+